MKGKSYLLAVDGDNALHRAYYGNPSTEKPMGYRINGVITFFRSINKMLRRNYYNHLAVAWDIRSTLLKRADILEPYGVIYKDRESGLSPEQLVRRKEIHEQKIMCHNLLNAMGVPSLISPKKTGGYEADDILATLAKRCKVSLVDILTTDKDLAQILSRKISIMNPAKNKRITAMDCEDFFGVEPDSIVDLLCLLGDSSDNVPGIKGCGPVTALKLLQQYGSLEEILLNKQHIKGSVGKTLVSGDHIPLDVIRSVIEVDCKVYKKGDTRLDPVTMSFDTIQENIDSNLEEIKKLKESLGIEGDLLAEFNI